MGTRALRRGVLLWVQWVNGRGRQMLPVCLAGSERAAQGTDAIGEYLAALSLAASNSSADAPALVKRLNSSVLDPTLSAGACAAHCQLFMTVTAAVVARDCLTFFVSIILPVSQIQG